MKAVILAAGKGSRLGALGESLPKPLLEVGGRPILSRHLECCLRHGVTEVFINTHHLPERIRAFCGDGSRFGLRIRYSFEPELLGTAGALRNFQESLAGDSFFVLYGDNLVEPDLGAMRRLHLARGAEATVALHIREDVSTSGMVVLEQQDRIVRFVEKPPKEQQVSHLVNAGVYCLAPSVFGWIGPGASDFGHDVFPAMLAGGRPLHGYVLEGDVLPADTPELLHLARSRA